MRAFCIALVLSVAMIARAQADWLRSDAKVVAQSGYLFGLAAYCGLDQGSALLAETMSYANFHKSARDDVRAAGQLFREGSEMGQRDMSDPEWRVSCDEAEALVERRIEELRDANAAGDKLGY